MWVGPGARNAGNGMNWSLMLNRSHGGPGEPPGRAEAIVRAQARSAEKRLARGGKPRGGGESPLFFLASYCHCGTVMVL